MVWSGRIRPARPDPDSGSQAGFGTRRHGGCFMSGDNFRKDSTMTMRLMQQTFLMTDVRKRVALLTLLSFVALC